MENKFVSFEIAKELVELDFNDKCFGFYSTCYEKTDSFQEYSYNKLFITSNKEDVAKIRNAKCVCDAPLINDVIDWFEEKGIIISFSLVNYDDKTYEYEIFYKTPTTKIFYGDTFKTKREAKIDAIKQAIILYKKYYV